MCGVICWVVSLTKHELWHLVSPHWWREWVRVLETIFLLVPVSSEYRDAFDIITNASSRLCGVNDVSGIRVMKCFATFGDPGSFFHVCHQRWKKGCGFSLHHPWCKDLRLFCSRADFVGCDSVGRWYSCTKKRYLQIYIIYDGMRCGLCVFELLWIRYSSSSRQL